MDFIRVNRSDIIGRKKSRTACLEAVIGANALNRTGATNYNAFGVKDDVGFEEATEKFIDNFLLRVLVPDYNIKDGKNIFVGSQNKMIRELLDAHGLTKCTVKAIVFAPCCSPSVEMIQKNAPTRRGEDRCGVLLPRIQDHLSKYRLCDCDEIYKRSRLQQCWVFSQGH